MGNNHGNIRNSGWGRSIYPYPAVVLLFLLFSGLAAVFAQEKKEPPGITEKLGSNIDRDIVLCNEKGDSLRLGDLIDKPVILSFVYYNCPGICTPLLQGLLKVVDQVKAEPGRDFRIITISINKDDTPELARQKKRNHLGQLQRDFPADQWSWLTGDSIAIERITRSAGFGFKRTGEDFAHGAALIALSEKGMIARYLYGISFNPFDVKMALIEASENRTGPSIAKVIKFCFSYDPEGRSYVFNANRISGIAILLTLIAFAVFLRVTSRKNQT